MADLDIRKITLADFAPVTAMLGRAFDDDPWFNFVAAQDSRRVQRIQRWLARGLTKKTFPFGETYVTSGCEGAALWVPPGSGSGNRVLAELELRLTLLRVSGRSHRRVRRAIRLIQESEPHVPHFELRVVGVDPAFQRRGIAARLLRPVIERCDQQGLPIGLMCTRERNVGFYERFGFRVTNEIEVPAGPRLWNMWRTPIE